MERVRKRGTEVELIELADEDLANQAVVGGQADVGLGAPYGLIQGSGAPLRIFCQLQRLRFFPVVDKAAYPDWQSLDGETFAVHSRGSTTEALAHIIEQEEGIEFGKISYVPGAEVRATALLRGNVKAARARHPEQELRDVRGAGQVPRRSRRPRRTRATRCCSATRQWMEQNQESVQVLLEEILTVWRSIDEDPEFVAGGAGAARAAARPAGRAREGAAALLRAGRRGGSVHRGLRRRGGRARTTSSSTAQPASSRATRRTSRSRTSGPSSRSESALSAVEESGN